jgi:hypothetical protein
MMYSDKKAIAEKFDKVSDFLVSPEFRDVEEQDDQLAIMHMIEEKQVPPRQISSSASDPVQPDYLSETSNRNVRFGGVSVINVILIVALFANFGWDLYQQIMLGNLQDSINIVITKVGPVVTWFVQTIH